MLDQLRTPFFLLALVLILLVVLAELGLPLMLGGGLPNSAIEFSGLSQPAGQGQPPYSGAQFRAPTPPGIAIFYMGALDGLLLYIVVLIGAPLVVPERFHGRVQGLVTLIFSLLVLLAEIALILAAIVFLLVMVTLLLSPIFGTIAYLAMFGGFDRSGARAILSLLMALKLGFAVCMVLAHQRFLQNKGLVLIVITSLVANVVIAFLHGFVPAFLASITDAVAAIVIGILAAIWALVFLIGSVPSIFKVLRVDRALP